MKCPNCGCNNYDWVTMCGKCGQPVTSQKGTTIPTERKSGTANMEQKVQQVKRALKEWDKENSSGQTGGGVCDDCNRALARGNTYLRPGGYLCCESCTDAFLNLPHDWEAALENLNRYFGPGIPGAILSIARRDCSTDRTNTGMQATAYSVR